MKLRMSVAAVIAASSVALTGCGSTTTTTTADASKAAAYVPLTKDNLGDKQLAAAQKATSAHMSMTLGSMGSGEGDIATSPIRMKMSMHVSVGGQSGDISMIFVDDAFYMHTPDQAAGKYLKIDASTPGLGALIKMLKNMSPETMAKAVAAGVVSVTYDGAETIDAATTHHYTVVVDAVKSAEAMGVDPTLLAQMKKVAQAPVTEEIYLNEDNTPRRIVMPLPSVGTVQMNFTNWNETVDIQAPAASDVVTK